MESRAKSGEWSAASTASFARILAVSGAEAHHGPSAVGQHRAHVGEVEVDQPGPDHQLADAADAVREDRVGVLERVERRQVRAGEVEQAVVLDDQHRVDVIFEHAEALERQPRAAAAFEAEGEGDHADDERARFARQRGHHRRRAGAGATAEAGGHEDEVRALHRLPDGRRRLPGRAQPDRSPPAGAQAARDPPPEREVHVGGMRRERLHVGVRRNHDHAFDAARAQVPDRVSTRASDSHDPNVGSHRCHVHRATTLRIGR